MEVNYEKESPTSIQPKTVKKLSIRLVLNLFGIFLFVGFIISAFTIPMTISPTLEVYQDEEVSPQLQTYQNDKVTMGTTQLIEIVSFMTGVALLYFILINVYNKGAFWRKLSYGLLLLTFLCSLIMIFVI